MPSAQTASVARSGDAADDPAIWVHPEDAKQSRVFATNKKQGLLSYDLQGAQKQLIEAGRLNNVDVRQNLNLGGANSKTADLAVATQRDENALAVFEIDAQGQAHDVARIATGLAEIYGTCLYRTPQGGLEVFANDKYLATAEQQLALTDVQRQAILEQRKRDARRASELMRKTSRRQRALLAEPDSAKKGRKSRGRDGIGARGVDPEREELAEFDLLGLTPSQIDRKNGR